MANESFRFHLPVGRIVSGSPTYKQDKDMQGKPKEHPNWFMAVAVDKNAPGVVDVINLVMNTARAGYAANNAILQRINGGIKSGFRWKIDDGDDPEDPKNRGKEGWAGCWIFKFSTTFGIMNTCDKNGNQIDAHTIKTGHFVDVIGSTSINGNTDHTAGVYMNPVWVRFQWYGTEIQSGPTPEQAFQGAPPSTHMPAGASATPLGRGGPAPQPQGGFGGGGQPQGQIGYSGPPQGGGNAGGFGGGQPNTGPGGHAGGFAPGQPNTGPGGSAGGFGGGPQPGFAQPQPQPQPQPGFNPNQPQPVQGGPTAEQIAAHYGVQHHPGWRWNPATNKYDEERAGPPAASGPGAQAGGFGAPAHAGGPAGFPGTASPSNAYPGATPHHGF